MGLSDTTDSLKVSSFSIFLRKRCTSDCSVGSTSLGQSPSVWRMELCFSTMRSVFTSCSLILGWVSSSIVDGLRLTYSSLNSSVGGIASRMRGSTSLKAQNLPNSDRTFVYKCATSIVGERLLG